MRGTPDYTKCFETRRKLGVLLRQETREKTVAGLLKKGNEGCRTSGRRSRAAPKTEQGAAGMAEGSPPLA